jgi:hypothetical protein
MQTERKYWFPAKRYGWGWGMPSTWQGWLVLAAFVVLVFAGSSLFPPGTELGRYLIYVAVLCGLLVGVCWLKGEPPHWRWATTNAPDPPQLKGEKALPSPDGSGTTCTISAAPQEADALAILRLTAL